MIPPNTPEILMEIHVRDEDGNVFWEPTGNDFHLNNSITLIDPLPANLTWERSMSYYVVDDVGPWPITVLLAAPNYVMSLFLNPQPNTQISVTSGISLTGFNSSKFFVSGLGTHPLQSYINPGNKAVVTVALQSFEGNNITYLEVLSAVYEDVPNDGYPLDIKGLLNVVNYVEQSAHFWSNPAPSFNVPKFYWGTRQNLGQVFFVDVDESTVNAANLTQPLAPGDGT